MGTVERYESKVDRSGGPDACHPWTSPLGDGYGQFWDGGFTASGHPRMVNPAQWGYEHYVLGGGVIPPDPSRKNGQKMSVCHTCDNPSCQNPDHWFLGTHADNMADMASKNRHADVKGEAHPQVKLTAGQVLEIRDLVDEGVSRRQIASMYGVSKSTVGDIASRTTWSHL